ncbi:MAG: oxidoreductase [Gammaproteobacteria bacterium]|jgi:choline dehydrogenase|nr:oxidoreductase [Gammaproteobacteria bacterium]
MNNEVDYIIVGAGSSGCVLAEELSKDPSVEVTVIESGPPDTSFLIDMPRGIGKLLTPGNPHTWQYEVNKGDNRPKEIWLKGKTLGGSSSINGLIYTRGHPGDYDNWEAHGCTGWGWKDMLSCFMAIEDHELGAGPMRGASGPLKVTIQSSTELSRAVVDAAVQAGLKRSADINSELGDCIGFPPRTLYRGARQSAAKAFLHPAMSRPNLHVLTRTDVVRIVIENRRVTGVQLRDRDGMRILKCRREVICSAGALESPKLLQLSGIGPAALLRSLGIEVIADLPNVGRNMRDHVGIETKFRVTRGSLNQEFHGLRLVWNMLRYFANKTGPMALAASEFNGLFRSDPSLPRPDCQIMGGLYTMFRTEEGLMLETEPGLTISGFHLHPQSQGDTAIRSRDWTVPPIVNANYLATEGDRRAIMSMVKFYRKVSTQPALVPFLVSELVPGPAIQTDDDLMKDILERGVTAYHVSGTCRMGSDPESVVDPQLRVRGVQGLRVCDTSIFPDLMASNTNAPAMAAGKRASKIIREAWVVRPAAEIAA